MHNTLILEKTEGKMRRGWQRKRWLDSITYSMDMDLNKRSQRVGHDLMTENHHSALILLSHLSGFPGGSDSKESACNEGDLGLIPGLGRSPGEGNGNPLQYSCLENPMDRGALRGTVHGVAKSWTQLRSYTFTFNHLLTD